MEAFFTPNRKNTGRFSRETKQANITVRNFPATVAEIRRKTGLDNGGDTYLFATRLPANEWCGSSARKYGNSPLRYLCFVQARRDRTASQSCSERKYPAPSCIF
ncbi:MAG: hypothetical protein LBH72_00515 [Proteiniphilum sp.]|nr:hypothetical protein [Proteiniphilum sp.]